MLVPSSRLSFPVSYILTPTMRTPLLTMQGITKRFGAVTALDGVDLEIAHGEIHGLLGGNGAGKTTLMNILYGLYKPDSGQILVDGQPLACRSPRDAIATGIGMVHQQFLQVSHFTVTENIVLGAPLPNRPTLDLSAPKARIRDLAEHFGLPVDPDAQIHQLPMGIRQRVEILKALYRGAKILILDEPTTNLTPQEVDGLFASLHAMVADGLSVVFITHKLREVLDACHRISVLRHGRNVLTLEKEGATEQSLVEAMVDEELDVEESLLFAGDDQADFLAAPGEATTIRLADLTIGTGAQAELKNCSLSVREGEILGIAGVAGNGQLALAESALGLRTIERGIAQLGDRSIGEMSTRELWAAGIAYIPEDRWQDGSLPTASVAQNLILGSHRRAPYSDGRFLRWRQVLQTARQLIDEFQIHTQGPNDTAGNLSGGNIQRLMLARAFARQARLLIAHNPTRGLDIPSIEFVYAKLLERQEQGMATILISENLDELFLLSHRIAVLCNGELMGILDRGHYDRYLLGRMMSGVNSSGSIVQGP